MLIKMDYVQVNKMMSEMIHTVKEVKNEIECMEETVEDLGIFWESEASMEYAMRITTDFYTAKAMLSEVKAGIRALAESVQRFDAAERSIRELIEEM